MIKYFASYVVYTKGQSEFIANGEIAMPSPVAGLQDVELMTTIIKDELDAALGERNRSVSVINWQRFENPQPAEYGMKCPRCGYLVDDEDYWAGDKCLRCAMEIANKEE